MSGLTLLEVDSGAGNSSNDANTRVPNIAGQIARGSGPSL